ncbi:MAG: MBL fold metallo-hydrolase, partial [Dermatophilaceae bacterium]
MSAHPIRAVRVISTGGGAAHPEHLYGTRKPTLWWIFASRKWVTVPVNVYIIEHADGVVLFDTGADPAAANDPDYWPDPVTALFARHLFQWNIKPDDALAVQLKQAGYTPDQVAKAVLSHLHFDHAGGIGDIPNADLRECRGVGPYARPAPGARDGAGPPHRYPRRPLAPDHLQAHRGPRP